MSTGYAMAEETSPDVEYSPRQKAKPKKKGNFFTRWMLKSLKEAVSEEQREKEVQAMNQIKIPRGISVGTGPSLDSDKGIRFQVYKANGGMIVETAMYDRNRDRHITGLHIITDDKDLGQELGKIITMETLKQ